MMMTEPGEASELSLHLLSVLENVVQLVLQEQPTLPVCEVE